MSVFERTLRLAAVVGFAVVAYHFASRFGSGGLWRGLEDAHAVSVSTGTPGAAYDLTELRVINETLKKIRNKYVDPSRINPQQMFLSALNQVQREVAPVIVLHEDNSPSLQIRVGTEERAFRVDNVVGPWDVAARLREVFGFLQANLRERDVDLRNVEYAACNGMLRTLDPHSVLLSPEAYAEMNLSTSGHFGGLGIVISMRDQMLTVIRPMPDTPAGRGGLKPLDRITKIDNESTLNMPLDDAVARLRGEPGSKVTIWVHRDGRKGWTGSRPFELRREQIRIRSVDSRSLGDGIGYVALKQFQASTSEELSKALRKLNAEDPLRGLVLDLRLNPGGLLEQAARVADVFLRKGTIVSTVGGSDARQEKRARQLGTEPNYPVVVMVNGSSASASEIVAGALKNHNRAVLVGQTTFGKGSVQLVFSDMPDGAALKLTIAQYLTPGGISIQGMGVTPDIELDPMTADTLEMDLFRSARRPRERDLSKSLSNGSVRHDERPWVTLRYNLPEEERALERAGLRDPDEFRLDFPLTFARDLVQQLRPGRRLEQLEGARAFIESVQKREITRVADDLRSLGIDWAPAPQGPDTPGPSTDAFRVEVTTDRPEDRASAGQPMELRVKVTNRGKLPIYRLRAITDSDNPFYDEKELVFGRLAPGQSLSAKAPLGRCETEGREPGSTRPLPIDAKRVCALPLEAVTRQDAVKVRFSSDGGSPPPDAEIRPTVVELPRPSFAYSYHVVDNRPGNGDGRLARGEGATVYFDIRNTGRGPSYETQARLRNLTGNGLLLRDGRFDVSGMKPGETRSVEFTFDVLEVLKEDEVKLELSVVDQDLRVVSSERVKLQLKVPGLPTPTPSNDTVVSSQDLTVYAQPRRAAATVGKLAAQSVTQRTAHAGGFSRVALGSGRAGFVLTSGLREAPGSTGQVSFEPALVRSPPLLEVSQASLATRNDHVRIRATAQDADQVLDAYVFASGRKVHYKSNRNGSDPKQLKLDFDAQLEPGTNVITVVARENEDTVASRTLVVRREGKKGETLPTPKRHLFGDDWVFGATDF